MKLKFETEFILTYFILSLFYVFMLHFFPNFFSGAIVDSTTVVMDNFAISLAITIASQSGFIKAYCVAAWLSLLILHYLPLDYFPINFYMILIANVIFSFLIHVAYMLIKDNFVKKKSDKNTPVDN